MFRRQHCLLPESLDTPVTGSEGQKRVYPGLSGDFGRDAGNTSAQEPI